jgi:hypothetical protein
MRCTSLPATTLLVAALLATLTAAECAALRFPSGVAPGGRLSHVTAEGVAAGRPVRYVQGEVMPPIVVNVVPAAATASAASAAGVPAPPFDMSHDGETVRCQVLCSGCQIDATDNTAVVSRGEALFEKLSIAAAASLGNGYTLEFALQNVVSAAPTLMLATPSLESVAGSGTMVSLRFSTDGGFLTRAGQTRDIPVGPAAIPPFALQGVSQSGVALLAALTLTVSVVPPTAGTISDTESSKGASAFEISLTAVSGTNSRSLAGAVNGLRYWPTDASITPVLEFVPKGSTTVAVRTGALTLATVPQRSKFMLFDGAGFVQREGQAAAAVLNVRLQPPVVISLFTSGMVADDSNTGVVIRATSAQGVLTGTEAVVVDGTATFTDLMFTGAEPHSAVLTFTAGAQGGTPVQGGTLLTGAIAVEELRREHHLSFSPRSVLTAAALGNDIVVRDGETSLLPPLVVTLSDSANIVDTDKGDVTLTVSPVMKIGTATLTNNNADVVGGVATFTNLLITASEIAEFRLEIEGNIRQVAVLSTGTIKAARDPLAIRGSAVSAQVRAIVNKCKRVSGGDCNFHLRFADEFTTQTSFVYAEGQDIVATVGTPIPLVRITLSDRFGRAQGKPGLSENAPVVVAYTGAAPGAEALLMTQGSPPANEGVYQNGEYVFSCLQFAQLPAQLTKIRFAALDRADSDEPFLQIPTLSTGVVTVVPEVVGNVDVRFSAGVGYMSRAGQPFSAVLDTALPAIQVELVDSLYRFDGSSSGAIVVATVSSGAIADDGSREVIKDGRATFTSLKFSGLGDRPAITFTVYQSDDPVAGKSVTTGFVTLTAARIPNFELAFSPTVDENNIVTRPFQPLAFRNESVAVVKASVRLRDSAHVAEGGTGSSVTFDVVCDEGRLVGGPLQVVIKTTSACGCANFTNQIKSQDPNYPNGTDFYVRYKVTAATGSAIGLIGQSLVVGPITVESLQQQSSTCAANSNSPSVVAEFRQSAGEFRGSLSLVTTRLAFLMSVEPSRVLLRPDTLRPITRVDSVSLASWSGVKLQLNFGAPSDASPNQKSSSQLAAEFVGLRPGCDGLAVALQAAYYTTDDQACDRAKFQVAVASSAACAAAGTLRKCECYSTGVIATWGQACADEPALEAQLSALCADLAGCPDAAIQAVCTRLQAATHTSLLWLWALMGAVGGAALIAGIAWHRRLVQKRQRTTLAKNEE